MKCKYDNLLQNHQLLVGLCKYFYFYQFNYTLCIILLVGSGSWKLSPLLHNHQLLVGLCRSLVFSISFLTFSVSF